MKALILGAKGQVGRALAHAMPPQVTLLALGRRECDITDAAAVTQHIRSSGATLVFNCAAYTAVDRAEAEPEAAMEVNGHAAGRVAAACVAAGARLVHLSTDFVFDGSGGRPYVPSDHTRPLNVYGSTKRAGEQAVLAAAPDALIVRTAWVHAAEGSNFVRTILRLMAEREEVRVVDDQIGTPTWAPSLAHALWSLAGAGVAGIRHFTDAGVASWYDLAVAVGEEAAAIGLLKELPRVVPVDSAAFPTPARRPAYSVLDKSATWQAIGRAPPHWRANLRACLAEIADG